jgi:GT2 family glycosyltransferase
MAEPRFSILTPVYRPPRRTLKTMLASVSRQTYADWEHCLVDDCSGESSVQSILDQAATSDARVRVHHRDKQGGIVAATNDALSMARGEFVAFLDHDDELNPGALEAMAAAIDRQPDVDHLYSDHDKINKRGRHFDPFVKPSWSPDRLPTQMYTTHFRVIRRSLVQELGGLRPGFDGAQDWDLALRVGEHTDRIARVPGLLYHWRAIRGSAAGAPEAKPWAHEASRKAISDHVERTGMQASVEAVPGFPGHYWMRPALTEHPLVSIVIPTTGRGRDGEPEALVVNCVRSVVETSSYANYEFVIVIDEDAPTAVREELAELGGERLRLVEFEGPFNFSAKVNLGARESHGDQLLLLNDDVEVLPAGWRPMHGRAGASLPEWDTLTEDGRRIWIESMLAYALQEGVGAVGAKLYTPDGRLQHGGIIARGGLVGHPYYLRPGDYTGYMGVLMLAANFLAVTGACMMTPRAEFDRVGGFDQALPLNYNDVDYCLRLRRSGLRTVMVPQAELLHIESVSRGEEPPAGAEIEELQRRWGEVLEEDPYYPRTFVDSNYTLPTLTRKGELRMRGGIWPYLGRAQMHYAEGGPGLVARRLAGKIGRLGRSR